MMQLPQISDAELEVMNVLWEKGSATSAQIVEALVPASGWKPKTVQTLITRLVAKHAVQAERTDGKAYRYTPLVPQKEFQAKANQSFLTKIYNGSLKLMLASFVKEQKLTARELEELKAILEEEGK